jgi:hypothetical protein
LVELLAGLANPELRVAVADRVSLWPLHHTRIEKDLAWEWMGVSAQDGVGDV